MKFKKAKTTKFNYVCRLLVETGLYKILSLPNIAVVPTFRVGSSFVEWPTVTGFFAVCFYVLFNKEITFGDGQIRGQLEMTRATYGKKLFRRIMDPNTRITFE